MRAALRLFQAAANSASTLQPYTAGQRAGKLTTGLHGLPVHPNPLPELVQIYKATLSSIQSSLPQGVVYRQSAEAITQHSLSVVEKHAGPSADQGGEAAIEAIEKELAVGVIEEVIKVAEGEKTLVEKMAEWKS